MGLHKDIANIVLRLKYKDKIRKNNCEYRELFSLNDNYVILYKTDFPISFHSIYIYNFKTGSSVCSLPKNYFK